MPRLETLTIQGAAPNVLMADQMAWGGLEQVLGSDPVAKWALKAMSHEFVPAANAPGGENPCVKFQAEFVRSPVEEGEE